jgi:hypothetical protein
MRDGSCWVVDLVNELEGQHHNVFLLDMETKAFNWTEGCCLEGLGSNLTSLLRGLLLPAALQSGLLLWHCRFPLQVHFQADVTFCRWQQCQLQRLWLQLQAETVPVSTSLGGLVAKKWLAILHKYVSSPMSAWAEQNAAFLGHIPALVFIAVPHRGSAVASKAHHMLLSSAWQEVLRNCNDDHSVLQKLANDFEEVRQAWNIPVLHILEGKTTTSKVTASWSYLALPRLHRQCLSAFTSAKLCKHLLQADRLTVL